jgi:chitodextrinase
MGNKILTFTGIMILAGACTPVNPIEGPLHTSFGDAVRHNIAQQVIDPDPPYASWPEPDFNGERGWVVIDRYHRGEEKQVEAPVTTGLGAGAAGQ